MTRSEFFEEICDFSDLLNLCWEESLSTCEDIYSEDSMNEFIDEELEDMIRHRSWKEIRDALNDIPEGYDYYRLDGYGEWVALDDRDFDYYKTEVLREMDANNSWEDEPEEEALEFDEVTFDELLSGCAEDYSQIETTVEPDIAMLF